MNALRIDSHAPGGLKIEEDTPILTTDDPDNFVDVVATTILAACGLQGVLDPLEVADAQERNRRRTRGLIAAAAQVNVEDNVAILITDRRDHRVVVAVLKF
jgi:hypothetical protein